MFENNTCKCANCPVHEIYTFSQNVHSWLVICRYQWVCQWPMSEWCHLCRQCKWIWLQLQRWIHSYPVSNSYRFFNNLLQLKRIFILARYKKNPNYLYIHIYRYICVRVSEVWHYVLEFNPILCQVKCYVHDNFQVESNLCKCASFPVHKIFFFSKCSFMIAFYWLFVDINECASDPCQNDATCVDSVNGYDCNCTDGYTGTLCDTGIHTLTIYFCRH